MMIPRLPAAIRALIAAVTCLCLAPPAFANDSGTRFEITPFAAYRVGGSFDDVDSDAQLELAESSAWGVVVNGAVEYNTEWEVLYTRQSTRVDSSGLALPEPSFDINVDYLHFGGTYLFDGERVRPFIAMTIGATRFDPGLTGADASTFFSMSLGAGWKFRLAEHVGLRLEGRGYGTLVDNNSRLFCVSDGGGVCLITVEGRIITQWEARAGFTIRF
jgi:hypothetical protein